MRLRLLVTTGLRRDCKTSNIAKVRLELYWPGPGRGMSLSFLILPSQESVLCPSPALSAGQNINTHKTHRINIPHPH